VLKAMEIQPYMIHVDYSYDGPLSSSRTLPINKVQLIDQISYDYDQECWFTFNYYRGDTVNEKGKVRREILQTGIQVMDMPDEHVSVYIEAPDGSNKRELYFDANQQIWFELSRFKYKQEEKRYYYDSGDWVSGVVYAGTVTICVETRNEVIKEKLVFLPSGISERDYEAMLNDLYRIRQSLVQRNETNVSVSSKEERTAAKIHQILQELERPIRSISDNPKGNLTFAWEYKKADKAARFHPRTALGKEMDPGKDKYITFVNHETTNLYENKMIKQQLVQLRHYCEMYNYLSPLSLSDQDQKRNEMKALFEKSNPKIQRLLGKLEDANFEYAVKKLEEEITFLDKEVEKQKEGISDQLYVRKSTSTRDVRVTLDCTIVSYNRIKKKRQFKPYLITTFQSGWDSNNRETHLEFNQYSYVKAGKRVDISPHSYFITLDNQSSELKDHWKLWKAFDQSINLLETRDSRSVRLKITAMIPIDNQKINRSDQDILGEENGTGYREYILQLNSIDSILVNGEEIVTPSDSSNFEKELVNYLQNLDDEVDRLKTEKEEKQIDLNTVQQLQKLCLANRFIREDGKLFDKMIVLIDDLLDLPVFKEIDVIQLEPLLPTQLFMHDPYYQLIWKLFNSLEEEVGLSLMSNLFDRKMGVKKVEQLYETWCLFKILYIFTQELGWKLSGENSVAEYIDGFLGKSITSLKEFYVSITQGNWRIKIEYEPDIRVLRDGTETYSPLEPGKRTPDYVLSVYQNEGLIGYVYLDAKHKNFKEQGKNELTKELIKTSINKYGKMVPIDRPGWTLASFLVHSDVATGMENDINGENYYSFYNKKEFPNMLENADEGEVHKYGAIYLLPSAIYSFKNWFRMIMEFRVGAYRKCWSCGSDDGVKIEQHLTRSGYPKYYFTCSNCQEFWVKVHCRRKGDRIIKHTNNYHRQVLSDNSWFVVCPTCGDGYHFENT
jgi:hypothetical protein